MSGSNEEHQAASEGGMKSLPGIVYGAGIGLLVVYVVLVVLQLRSLDEQEVEWVRRMDLLGGLEALAFAAAGAIFGTTVQRQSVRQVQRQAEQAEARANENEGAAAKLQALEMAVTAKAERAPETAGLTDDPDALRRTLEKELGELAEVARQPV